MFAERLSARDSLRGLALTSWQVATGSLAGDVTKEASDLGLPMVGVGFMYPQGYLRQRIRADGWQEEAVESQERGLAPIRPACSESGRPCVVRLDLPGRALSVAVWAVRVGRVPLYLMDTDVPANAVVDRTLSARLYGGDQEMRLRQEIVLGIGGVRLLRALGIAPTVWHANEGRSLSSSVISACTGRRLGLTEITFSPWGSTAAARIARSI